MARRPWTQAEIESMLAMLEKARDNVATALETMKSARLKTVRTQADAIKNLWLPQIWAWSERFKADCVVEAGADRIGRADDERADEDDEDDEPPRRRKG
jgi:hypothetical protein